MNENGLRTAGLRRRVRVGLVIVILGELVFILGVSPDVLGLDRSPVTGVLQIAVFLVGLGMICVGGYLCLNSLWERREKSIAADIGLRLVSTGYLISVASGMADIFGFGSQLPPTHIPYLGGWQVAGVIVGELVIALGFLLMIPFPARRLQL